ncbi:MAG TPA: porin family protein [Vicinamibacterales bacterium]|nr:porin family protein [Vicinamibacterales bacterium]
MRSGFVGLLAFAAIGLCVTATPAAAQTAVGIKGGPVMAKLKTVPDSGGLITERVDWSGGIFLVPKHQSRLTVQFETLYSRRGTKVDADVFGFGLGDIRLTYLDVSGLVRLRAGDGETSGYLIAGPTVGIKLDAEVVVFGLSPSIDGAFKDTETSVTVGAGLETGRYVLEARYMHGLTNVIQGIDFAGLGAKSRVFSVMAGVRF